MKVVEEERVISKKSNLEAVLPECQKLSQFS